MTLEFDDTICIIIAMPRRYELKRRAEQQNATRRRIVEAATELYRTVGPDATTVSRIAERAGVGRVTVYRHFPDLTALALACGELHLERNPPPDPERWAAVSDPRERLRIALADVYAYYGAGEETLSPGRSAARGVEAMAPYEAHLSKAAEALVEPWGVEGRRRTVVRAAIGLALGVESWRFLTRDHGLTDDEAIQLVLCLAPTRPAAGEGAARREAAPVREVVPPRVVAARRAPAPPRAQAAPEAAATPTPEAPAASSRPLPSARRA